MLESTQLRFETNIADKHIREYDITDSDEMKKAKYGQQFFTLNFVKYCQSDKQKTTKPVQSALCIQIHTDWLSPAHPSRVFKKDDKYVAKQRITME